MLETSRERVCTFEHTYTCTGPMRCSPGSRVTNFIGRSVYLETSRGGRRGLSFGGQRILGELNLYECVAAECATCALDLPRAPQTPERPRTL